jgi:hypothetical protein
VNTTWTDPSADWWAKVRRAEAHIDTVADLEKEYLQRSSWRLDAAPGPVPHRTLLTLRISEPSPVDIPSATGDALHGLSSALDALAFAMARATYGPALDTDERLQKQTEFPVQLSRSALVEWWDSRQRRQLYGQDDVEALWRGQSVYWSAFARAELGLPDITVADALGEVEFDQLSRMRRLHNIDKHRRLHVVVFSPDLPYWGSNGTSLRRVALEPVWHDGHVVAVVDDPPSDARDTAMVWDLRLSLDEGDQRGPLVNELRSLAQTVRLCLVQTLSYLIDSAPPAAI